MTNLTTKQKKAKEREMKTKVEPTVEKKLKYVRCTECVECRKLLTEEMLERFDKIFYGRDYFTNSDSYEEVKKFIKEEYEKSEIVTHPARFCCNDDFTPISPTVEKWDIEKRFYEDLADNEWILDDPYSPDMVQMPFHELEKRVHTLLSHITEPTHSLISKIPSAYGVGSANLPEGDNWERKFDEAFEGTMCDGTGVDYGDTQREVKDFIRTLLALSVQEAKAEMVAEIENSKIISSIGYRPSKFRGLSAVAIYNMALDDLLASLKQEEEK